MTKAQLKIIMKTAWGEAKEAAKKFGGKSKEYISEAMKNAWSLLIEVWGITKKYDVQEGKATYKQINYIESLMSQLDKINIDYTITKSYRAYKNKGRWMLKADASSLISELKEYKKRF
ncbi:TPA: hypothetical protein REB19_001502 [Staphylococcus pseudintermedius]|uniref:hypothetical protein n=1 Tax=Staphylococcus pseudintermedius TaxID=283734 RepID=UPI001BDF1B40|nr:hypothetical protein [Staphylococcus pseudintermedius]EJD5757468.1 hypothetical protein [Staphylococcus pseudintermedius]EJG5118193.1 hypothetical protein [Staphylococcus pseudintermedius]HDT8481125.1 hypothetical protein [Staphylococcus pseudintermedius]